MVAIAGLVGLVGVLGASAASLGGVTSASLGADVTVVASCDTDGVAVAYTTAYDAVGGVYRPSAATVSGVDAACDGLDISVTLRDSTGAVVGDGSSTVSGGSASVPLTPGASTDPVDGVAVIISG